MSDDVRNLHARVAELTSRVNQLNAEKLYAERQTKTWKRLYFWTTFSTVLSLVAFSGSFGFWHF